jgi:putative drug exporter of the RND superfamily
LAGFLTRRAKLVIAAWLLVVAALAMQGRDLERDLTVRTFYVEGTQSKRAHDIAEREFGSELALVVMLRGPEAAVEGQARRLAKRLDRGRRFLVLSPWSSGAAAKRLRPRPGVVGLVVRAEGIGEDATAMLPPVERQIDAIVDPPVQASVAGLPALFDSLRTTSEDATATGEMIAIPALLMILLFVFRSVLAALMPLLIGGAVVAAGRGVLSLLTASVEMDLFALGVVGMLGLALGVDYSLLTVSRFREERRKGGDPTAVAEATIAATARAVVPAGCGLLIAMLAAMLVYPSLATRSIAIAVSVVTVLSMLSALCVVPALLALLGDNLDRWSLRERRTTEVAALRWSRRLVARPGAVMSIVVVLLFFSGWAFALDSGLASVGFLPRDEPGRVQQEAVERELGPGWTAPIEVIVNSRGGPVTSPQRLRALADFHRRIERDPGVESVTGFATIEKRIRPLGAVEDQLADQQRGLERLETGISRLHEGAVLNTDGLLVAAEGARAVHFGLGATDEGAGLLAEGLDRASAGSTQLSDGLGRASDGSGELAQGTAKASKGAGRLAEGLEQAREGTGEINGSTRLLENAMRSGEERLAELREPLRAGEGQLDLAWQALQRMTVGREDPEYAAALQAVAEAHRSFTGDDAQTGERADPAFGGVGAGVERAEGQFEVGQYLAGQFDAGGRKAANGIGKLAKGSARLDRGLRRLRDGSRRLARGIGELADGGETLSPAVMRIGDGAAQLADGLGQLESGAGQLAGGLAGGGQKSKLLGGGLRRIATALENQQAQGGDGLRVDQLQTQSPSLFRSGYFSLAVLAGSPPGRREQLNTLLSLDSGGGYGRMLVIPRDEPRTPAAEKTKDRLEEEAVDLAARSNAEVVVGGAAPALIDADDELRDRAIWLRLALSLVSFLILVPVVRSLTIPILAALLNLLTVSACFGVLSLLFDGSLLGGPGYVDAIVLHAAMIVMFGLAIDYEVFVFSRMREEYVRTGSPDIALRAGLDRTAHVITGAAVIMITVFLAFSASELVTLRNFGVAQALGVFIDAFLIRLVVIPAVMARLGKWSWWMPARLDRLLPGGTTAPRPAPS